MTEFIWISFVSCINFISLHCLISCSLNFSLNSTLIKSSKNLLHYKTLRKQLTWPSQIQKHGDFITCNKTYFSCNHAKSTRRGAETKQVRWSKKQNLRNLRYKRSDRCSNNFVLLKLPNSLMCMKFRQRSLILCNVFFKHFLRSSKKKQLINQRHIETFIPGRYDP